MDPMSEFPLRPLLFLRIASTFLLPSSGAPALGEHKLQRIASRGSVCSFFAFLLVLLAGAGSVHAQTSLSVPLGSTSASQSANVTLVSGGTLTSIVVYTEGVNNLDFQLGSYNCSIGTSYPAGKVCQIGYTFAPEYAGLRRGGIALENSSGTPLGETYISGIGTGSQSVFYPVFPVNIATNTPPVIITAQNYGVNFAVDGAGNLYYRYSEDLNGLEAVVKAVRNSNGTYTTSNIYTGGFQDLAGEFIAVDGLGNVYFTDAERVVKLTPNNSGYSASVVVSGSYDWEWLSPLTVDSQGAVYLCFACSTAAQEALPTNLNVSETTVAKFTPNGTGGYTQSWVSANPTQNDPTGQNPAGVSDLQVDASGNVFLVGADGEFNEWVYNQSAQNYSINDAYENINGSNLDQGRGSYESLSLEDDGGFLMYDSTNIYKLVPNGNQYDPQLLYFYCPTCNSPEPSTTLGGEPFLREDAQGNIYVQSVTTSFPSGVEELTATIYRLGTSASEALNLGTVQSGDTGSTQSLEIANIGTSTGTGSIGFQGHFSSETPSQDPYASLQSFYYVLPSLVECSSTFSLPVGGYCAFGVAFTPESSDSGGVSGSVLFTNTNSNTLPSEEVLSLSGIAQHPLPTITSLSSSSGDAENPTTFTLTGTYLGDVSSVTFTPYGCFGQLTASFTILSTTELEITAPADACPGSTATITVTNPGGSATTGWTYNVVPSASNSTLTIAASSIPQNTTTSLTATIKNSSGNPLAGDLVTFTSSTTSVATAPTAITNNNGVATTTVTGIFPGTATFTASADGTSVSQTETVTVTAPDVSVGSSQTGLTATLTFATAGTLGNTLALSQGASNTDFKYDSSTCSAGTGYASGASCTVTYSFNPKAPGLRLGAIVMETNSGSVLGTTYLSGIGVGPQAEVFPGVSTPIPTSGEIATNVVTDALGNVYYGGAYTGVYKWSNGTTTSVTDIDIYGLAVDGAGNLLLSTNGFDGTVAGVYELANGTGAPKTIVTFSNSETPSGNMAFDGLGNLYVPLTNEIGKIATGSNVMTTIAVPSGAAVSGLAVDSAGDVFFVDNTHGNVDEIVAGGTSVTTVAAGISHAYGVAVDAAGNLYVSSFNAMQRLAAGTYAQTSLNGLSGYDLSIDSSGTLWMAQISGVVEENRTAGATLSFSSDVGVEVQQSMTLENDGNSALSVTEMAVSSPFTVDNSTTCSASISLTTANPVCTLVIDFRPPSIGNFTGTAAFTDNTLNAGGTTQSTPLNGTAYGTQTITFPQPTTPVLPNATATLTATASSGLAVTYAITSGPATVTGSTVTYTGTGTVVITASQAGNGSYVAATPVSVTVVVGGMSEPVGTASPTQSAIITISTAGTLQSINALTKGAANKDYKYVSGSTAANACAIGTAYSANATCTVTYSFTPTLPGQRLGAISLTSSSGAVMGTQFLSGIGTGPVAIFPGKPAISTLVTGLNAPQSTAVDGNGDVFYAGQNSNTVNEIVAVNGVVTSSSQVVAVGGGYSSPEYLTVDGAGNLFVTENFNNQSNEQNPGTVTEIVAVNGQVSTSSPVKIVCVGLNDPQGVAVDASGDIFVDDYGNEELKEVVASNGQIPANSTGNVLYTIGGEGLAVDASGDVFIAAANYASVVELVAVNGLVNSSSTIKYFSAGGEEPYDVRLDAAGNLFVADPGSMVLSQEGKGAVVSEIVAINGAVSSSSTVLTLSTAFQARGLSIDGQGHVFVADTNNNDIRELDMTTAPTLDFGSGAVGSVSAAQTTTLENAGNSALTLSALAPSSANFVLDGTSTTCSTGSPLAASGVCTVGADFTPAKSGALTGTINITDNSNSVPGSEQQIPLTGTGTTGATSQTITFPQPATPAANGSAPVSLAASASSGLAITYSVVSGPATVSGSTLTYTGSGTVVVEADQYGNATYAAAAPVQRTITVVDVVSYTAPATAVNATSATQTATINFTAAGTLGSIDALTQGTANLDFKQVAGGSCAVGTTYTTGQTCTVEYSFTPAAPGARLGAVVAYSNAATPVLMGTSYLTGTGNGPLALFTSGAQSTTVSGLSFATAVTVDGAGDIFYAEQTSGTISEIAAGSTTPTVILSGINTVTGLAIDGAGNLFYGAYGANKVYELVGASGTPQFVANVTSPDVSMAIDGAGNIYVPGNDVVTKIAAGTFAVTPFGSVAGSVPGVTVDASGNVYFADYSNNTIYEVAAGTTTPVALVTSGLSGPRGLAVDAAGNLYVANQSADNVLKLTAGTWAPTVVASGYGYGSLMMDQFGTLWSGAGSAVVNIARSTTTAAFPSTVLGNSNNLAVSLENDGNQPLGISALSASGTGFVQDSTLTTCSTTNALAVAGTCNVGATFAPQSAGAFTGHIDVTDNSLNLAGSLLQATLTGTGTAATPAIGAMSFSPASSEAYGASQIITISDSLTYPITTAPTGAVAFTLNGSAYTATCTGSSSPLICTYAVPATTIAALTPQSYTVTAAYAGDANYSAVTGPNGTLVINPSTPVVSVTNVSINPGVSPATLTATITYSGAQPTGAVTISVNSQTAVTASCTPASGMETCSASYATSNLTTGNYTIAAQIAPDSNYNTASGAGTLTVNPGPAAYFTVSAPGTAYAGTSFGFTITAFDQFNNVATGYTGTVAFSTSDTGTGVVLPANSTLISGVGTFPATLVTPGTQTITATDTTNSTITGVSGNISVSIPYLVVDRVNDDDGIAIKCSVQPTPGATTITDSCTLRDALLYAATLGTVNISFDSTTFATAQTIALKHGTLNIPAYTSITGPTSGSGAALTNLLTVDGGGSGGTSTETIFVVNGTGAAISNLNINNGYAASGGNGGAITNFGSLAISDSSFGGNQATGSGGAIFNAGGTLTVTNSTFYGNSAAGGNGGAIDNSNYSSCGTATITNSTFYQNTAANGGAGVGGAFNNDSGGCTLTVTNSTIDGNSSDSNGGGIFNASSLNLANSIIAGNTNGASGADDVDDAGQGGNFWNGSNVINGNLLGTYDSNPQTGTNVNLAPIGSYGGPTQTLIPLPGSAAICAGLASNIPSGVTNDQRGEPNTNTTYPGYTGSTPCVDAGAVQTNYAIEFTTQPPATAEEGVALSPAPVVSLTESGSPIAVSAGTVIMSDSVNVLTGTLSETFASGAATFGNLVIPTPTSGDTLNATLALNSSINLTAQASQSISVSGIAGVTLSTTDLGFPSTNVGTTSTLPVTVTNSGTTNMTVNEIGFSGVNPTNFSHTSNCGGHVITPGNSCTIQVSFTPAAVGPYSATLNITDSATGSPKTVTLSGNGNAPTVTLSTTGLSFPSTNVGSTSTLPVTVTNSGTTNLTVSVISNSGTSPTSFSHTSNCGGYQITPGNYCTIQVKFTPTAAGPYSATLNISDNATGSPQTVTLSGNGSAPTATLSTTALSFPSTDVGTTSTLPVTVTNSGTTNLTVSVISNSGTNPTNFSHTSNCGGSPITPGNYCTIQVNFTPTAAGPYSATLNITDNATGSPQTVTLSGNGNAPTVMLSTTGLSFPSTKVGSTSTLPVTVTNTGTSNLTVSVISNSGTNPTDFTHTSNCGGHPITPGNYCTIQVIFNPAATGPLSATLNITDNATGSPQTVTLNGTGQ